MSQINVTLPDGSSRSVPPGTTVGDLAAVISPGLAKAALAGKVGDRLVDLSYPLTADASLQIITSKNPSDALPLYRHSTAHLLAAAVTNMFPGVQCGIGPPTDEGFFYDFVVPRPFVPEDLEAIENRMREMADQDLVFERQMWPRDEAKQFFRERGEPLKVQLIEEKTEGQDTVSCYTIKDKETFVDFCVGPHVPSTGKLKAFKLLSTSNAYWKGDARNQPMQRVYGTAFLSEKELKDHLTRIEEAKKRDHRKIGRDQKLFMFHQWAPGATFWLPNGTTLYNLLANYMRDVLIPSGYTEVKAPIVFNKALWETSGHWSHYRQNMFLVESEGEQMGLKAMNCPGHMLIFGSEVRSYRDLPIRYHEQTPLHRNEASGVLSGLTRVRQFSQDDGHCFVMESQIGDEVEHVLRLVQRVYGDFGMKPEMKLSTRPPEFLGADRAVGPRRGRVEARARRCRGAVHDQRGRRRVLRTKDRLRRRRRDRPQVAVRDDSARLPDPAALRSEVHRRRQRRAPAGRDTSGDLRQLRALHCAADRALCRGLAALAGAGAGRSFTDLGPASGLCCRGARPVCRTPGSGSSWTIARRRLVIKSERPSCRRCRTCSWPAIGSPLRGPSPFGAGLAETSARGRSTRSLSDALDEVRRKSRNEEREPARSL